MTEGIIMSLSFKLLVAAGSHDRQNCPVVFGLPRMSPLLEGAALGAIDMQDENGKHIPVQVVEKDGKYKLHWIVEKLAAKETAAYRITAKETDSPESAGVRLVEAEHRLNVVIDGEYFTSYVFDPALAKPYIGPVLGSSGGSYTRLDFNTREHPHHRSIWLGIGDVNGIDTWNEPAAMHGRQIMNEIMNKTMGPVLARIESRQAWTSFAGKPQLEETRIATFYRTPAAERFIDLEFTLHAKNGRVEFGSTKEAGPLGIRVAESMKADNGGTMVNSYGSVGESECWGQRAEWCDYHGDVEGHLLGIATFDHPDNLDFPTYWHIRNYGLMAPNNLYFLGGKLLQKGESLRYKYRMFFHEGSTAEARVMERYQDYIHPPKVELVKERLDERMG